jgi:hypothetical protein
MAGLDTSTVNPSPMTVIASENTSGSLKLTAATAPRLTLRSSTACF